MQRAIGKRRTGRDQIVPVVVALVVFFVEFLVKNYLRVNHAFATIAVIKNIFHITVVFNSGAAFGILRNNTNLLVYVALIFLLGLLFWFRQEKQKTLLFLIAIGLIVGGAFSNLYDRLVFGYVIDYLDFRVWPVFNLADSAITVGAGLLLLDSFQKNKHGTN